ncbi:uncharacterized protein B0P05DRAFT_532387 [Gilbertella persicaria]|uniref:uncharacterized protein n=1 Tax=Gilbertella persicaria TaxID=101096 RepID=UPI00221F3F0B|nr:uncharacterized protein B0P05DRAFT_532387 [Gilbertella persicaria]KAI8087815.1 hypothetical protein B0P05DRAFT_532387 [Gilbertella persicaria]
MKSNRRLLFALAIPFLFHSSFAEKTAEQYLAEGNQYLTTGKLNDALMSFDAAIQQRPSDYISYYKRATAYLSLGRTSAAIDDFSTILNLKPGFEKALLQRAKLYAADGEFSLAKKDLLEHKDNQSDPQVKALLDSVEFAESQSVLGQTAFEDRQYEQCIQHMTEVIRVAPQRPQWRLVRAKCHIGKNEIEEAANDFTRVAHLNPSDKQLLYNLASLNYFSLYEPDRALTQVKQCIHYDPEDRACKSLFRLIKRIEKEIKKSTDAQSQKRFATAMNALIGTRSKPGIVNDIDAPYQAILQEMNAASLPKYLHLKIFSLACAIASENKDTDKANKWCQATLELDPDNKDALKQLGEMKLNDNDFEGAVRDLEKAFEASGQQDHQIRQLLQRAQQLLKQSKKRDYYKILDIPRDADSRSIKKAYRKKAHEWHPDKYSGELDKSQVESKMADINQAYEVLSDPEKREQFDNGFDPYDPESNQQQHHHNPWGHQHNGNPFAHFGGAGGFHFGGQGQQFSFHF